MSLHTKNNPWLEADQEELYFCNEHFPWGNDQDKIIIRYLNAKNKNTHITLEFVLQALQKSKTVQMALKVIGMIQHIPEQEREQLLQFALKNERPEVQFVVMEMIVYVPEQERTQLVKQGLENTIINIQLEAIKMIQYVPEQERAQLVKQGLKSISINTKLEVIKMIQYIPEQERAQLIKQVLQKTSINMMQLEAIKMIQYVPEQERKELIDMVISMYASNNTIHNDNMAINHPLYKKWTEYFKKPFYKSWSELTVFWDNSKLTNKIIMRTLPYSCFIVWQKAFEWYKIWLEAWFDYVPIEPIMDYSQCKENLDIDVYAQVLDNSLNQRWERCVLLYYNYLCAQKESICKTLRKMWITHGHLHDGNFCIRFVRKEDWSIDYTKIPRLYLIDRDRAEYDLLEDQTISHR
jgi:hypothetical protein